MKILKLIFLKIIVIAVCDLTSTLSGGAYENFPDSTFTKRLKNKKNILVKPM